MSTRDTVLARLAVYHQLYPDWHLFPISGKVPRVAKGQDWRDPVPHLAWRASDQIGLACGPRSVDVVDFDVDKTTGQLILDPERDRFWSEYIETHQPATATTPSGGVHILVRGGSLAEFGNAVGVVPGVDIRTAGGYIVVPSENDPMRSWVRHPLNHRIGPADPVVEWLRQNKAKTRHERKTGGKSQIVDLRAALTEAAPGTRNDLLARWAGHWAKRVPEQDVFEILVDWGNSLLQTPLDHTELEATVYKLHGRTSREAEKPDTGVMIRDGRSWI